MSLVCATAGPVPAATPSAVLFNEGLEPGRRVTLDDRDDQTATVCFVEPDVAYTHVRMDGTGQRLRIPSWRLALLG